ncbi:MAG: prepilin peptidase [bacterium]
MLLFYLFIIGLAVGSFLNVLIDRLPKEKSIMGRSYCDNCKKQLKSIDLIPILSFLILKGKCRLCKKKINFRYPIVELLTGVLFVLSFIYLPGQVIAIKVLQLALISALIVIFFADLRYRIIPDQMLIFAGIIGFLILLIQGSNYQLILFRFVEGLLTALPIFLVYELSKHRAMGFGDVKLAYIIGFIFGLQKGLTALYFAFILGALIGLVLIFMKKKTIKSKVAFGPFIVLGSFLVLFVDKVDLFMLVFFSN